MAENTILDYDKMNKYLPDSLRNFVGAVNRVFQQDYRQFFCMYQGIEQMAVFNNEVAAEFASGFVNRLNYKYLRSGTAPRLLDILVSKAVGRLYYQSEIDEAVLDRLFNKDYFSDAVYKASTEAAQTGRSVMVLYGDKENKEDINIVSYNLFRHKIKYDKKDNVDEAWLYLVKLDSNKVGYENIICEHRFYKTVKDKVTNEKVRIPFQEFLVYGITYSMENKEDAEAVQLEQDNIPDEILQAYPDIKFGVPQELDMSTIGVYDIVYSKINKKFTDSKIPEAMFVDAVDNALVLDTSLTDKEVEKEIGRGQILIPEFGLGSDVGGYQTQAAAGSRMVRVVTNYKNPIVMPYPSRSMEDNKPTNIQFDIRAEQWENFIKGDIERLCASVGIGIIDYLPSLLGGIQRTDDEVNALTDMTANTVQKFRNLNTRKLNQLLELVVEILGLEKPVAIRWSMASILNPTKNTDLVIKQLTNGLISRKEAIKRCNPDLTENEVNQIYTEVQQEIQAQDINASFSNF